MFRHAPNPARSGTGSTASIARAGKAKGWDTGRLVLGYRTHVAELRTGTSFMSTRPGTASGPPEVVKGVDDLTMPVGTRDAVVPRGYLMPANLAGIAAKLRAHNVRVAAIAKPMRVEGE